MKLLSIIKSEYFYLLIILVIGFFLRVYKLDAPIADWHSWRQADTAAVTRNFIKEGFNPFIPKYDDMSGVSETPIINPLRFRFVEFPVYNIFVYPLYLFFGVEDKYSRLVSIIFSLGSTVLLYLIARKYLGKITALLSSLFFAVLPFNVFFSRTTLPEPTFVFFGLGMIYFMERWISSERNNHLVLAFIFTSVAFLIKPWAIFFYLPLLYLVFKKSRRFWIRFFIISTLAFIPFFLWRLWILQQPEGIPASSWLLNSDGIRFRPAFFWWLLSERLGGEILGVTGAILFFFGVLLKPKNNNYFLHAWLLSAFLFMIVFATGNVRHNYYQIMFVPIASIFTAVGAITILKGNSLFIPRIWTLLIILLFVPLTFYFTHKQVNGFYQINNSAMIEAGKKADQILPKDAKVIAPYNGDTAFLYQTNRAGLPFIPFPLKDLIADYNFTHYISTSFDNQTNWVMRYFKIIEKTPNYVIVDLTRMENKFDKLDPEP